MIRIGYACLALAVPDTGFKSCIMKNATDEKLRELISHNLKSLENLIEYNNNKINKQNPLIIIKAFYFSDLMVKIKICVMNFNKNGSFINKK